METKQNSGPKINKEEKTGLAGILSALGWNSAAGEAASGGLGGIIDAATSGGILATKAGIVGMVLVGSTIAGGVGWLGYKTLGPGASDKAHAHFQIFKPRPPQASAANGSQGRAASGSGTSSLGYAQQANQGAMGENALAVSQTAPASAAVATGAAPKSPNAGKAFGGKGAMPKISGSKIGQLSNLGTPGGMAMAPKVAPTSNLMATNASPGALGGSPRAAAAGRGFGSSGGGSGSGANRTGVGTGYGGMGPNNVPGTRLFDSGSSGLGTPSGPGIGGLGNGAPNAFPNAPSNGGGYSPQGTTVPPTGNGADVTPWQGAINLAIMLSLLAGALMYAAYKVSTTTFANPVTARIILGILGAIIAAVGGFIAHLGQVMAGGEFGQSFQGGAFILSGTFIMLSGAAIGIGGGMGDMGSATSGHTAATGGGMAASGWTMGIFMACGAVGLLSAMAGYLVPGQQYPATMFYGNPPDWTNPNAQVNPNPMMNGGGSNYP